MRMSGAGTDSFTDIGIDTQYQYLGNPHTVTLRASWIRENHNTSASQTLGLADNSNNNLRSLNVSASYIYDHTWSFTAGRMSIGGTADAALYGTFTGSPNSAGWIDDLFQQQAAELDTKRREAILHKMQQLVHDKAIYAPIWQLAFMNAFGPRVGESGFGLIPAFAYTGPYEDMTIKSG